jgi:hypothetical protein
VLHLGPGEVQGKVKLENGADNEDGVCLGSF